MLKKAAPDQDPSVPFANHSQPPDIPTGSENILGFCLGTSMITSYGISEYLGQAQLCDGV